ncbi:MAG: hypothetical protein IJ636_04885 [Bacteroidales bacterium]|nr:hypothetical protein [Bacteroidales bacterium]
MEKRNEQHPFDCQSAERFALEAAADPVVNNSYYFSAHDKTLSFYARLGKRSNLEETWFFLYLEGRTYSLKQEFFPAGGAPVRVENTGGKWTVSYEGILNETDQVRFRGTFIPSQQPIDFTTDMPAERMAVGIANERWNRAFFSELKTINGQCHYEQEGVLEGRLSLNGKEIDFRLPCVRDHSFGKRDWNQMNNHLWLMAVSSSVQFNYSLVSYPAISVLEVGNYRDGEGQHFLRQADLDFHQIGRGTIPGELSFHVKLDDLRALPVTARVLTGTSYRFQDGQYILHENIAEFVIDGNACRGILEIGFNHDDSRFFNQRDLRMIRR